jgi:predicted Zn-dependent protease
MKKFFLMIFILFIYQAAAFARESVILSAMEDELARSMEELKLEDQERPYYLSYLVKDIYSLRITADSGAIIANSESRSRNLRTDLRVGNYALDNSNFMSLSTASLLSGLTSGNARIAVDDDYDVLRRQIWLATDRAYKNALDTIAKKKASLQNTVRAEIVPDFTKGAAKSSFLSEASFDLRKDRWTQIVDQLSKLFLKQRQIQKSKVDLKIQIINSYYANSEGAKSIEPAASARLVITASTQADDGMPVGNYLLYTAQRPEGLPDKKVIQADIHTMMNELLAVRTAPVAEDYSGPILFVGQAAGELFGQGFGGFLLGKKSPVLDNPQANSMIGPMMDNPFSAKINRRVAAKFLSMAAQPSLREFNGRKLLGAYEMDEEGVPCSDVTLIQNGMLRNLLTTRAPIKGFAESNGHSRGGSPLPSVIRITSTNAFTTGKLKQELIRAVEEEGLLYGYVVKGLTPPSEAAELGDTDIISGLLVPQQGPPEPTQFMLTRPYSVFRLYPDGKEEPVRGLEFRSLNINVLKDIIATSDEELVYDYPVNATSMSSGILSRLLGLLGGSGLSGEEYYATVITPSFLIGELDMKTMSGNYQKPPIVGNPLE